MNHPGPGDRHDCRPAAGPAPSATPAGLPRKGSTGSGPRAGASVWRALILLFALVSLLPLASVRAEANLTLCRRWQRSSGPERIRLANAIGAAAYLTRLKRLAETSPEQPQLLYRPADLRRACNGWH